MLARVVRLRIVAEVTPNLTLCVAAPDFAALFFGVLLRTPVSAIAVLGAPEYSVFLAS